MSRMPHPWWYEDRRSQRHASVTVEEASRWALASRLKGQVEGLVIGLLIGGFAMLLWATL